MDKNPFGYTFCMLTLFVFGSFTFLYGFFPASELINHGRPQQTTLKPKTIEEISLSIPSSHSDQLILMIVDALRLDFPNETSMPYSYGSSCNFLTLKADIPTVTMPRLKSITTGSISNFIDIVLNLGHTDKLSDSVLHRLKYQNKNAVFAGDHTWMKLFPNIFKRHKENIDSFFVNDFYEGDRNVTAALNEELKLQDWQFLILHYLGLDHIGHVEGSHTKKIYEKLLDMDNVIKHISHNSNFRNQILLVTGDHGMRTGGGHGGSEKEELYVPLVVLRQNCSKQKSQPLKEYNQIDMAPTLAILLDVDIPSTSIGCLITELIEQIYSTVDQLYFYYYNVLHLIEMVDLKFGRDTVQKQDYYKWFTDAKSNHKDFLITQSALSYEKSKQNYVRLSNKISEQLSESLVKFDYDLIAIALVLTSLTALHLLFSALFESSTDLNIQDLSPRKFVISILIAIPINFIFHYMDLISAPTIFNSVLLTFPIAFSIYLAIDLAMLMFYIALPINLKRRIHLRLSIPLPLLSAFIFHTLSLASSSLIEEEHQTWYYLTPTLLLLLLAKNVYNNLKNTWHEVNLSQILTKEIQDFPYILLLMLSIILCRRLNQTGDKWRHLRDIGDFLIQSDNHLYLTLTFLIGLVSLLWILRKYNSHLQTLTCTFALTSVFLYRTSILPQSVALLAFGISLVSTAFIHYRSVIWKRNNYGYEPKANLVELLKTNLTCCLLISALLHKQHNVILLSALIFTLEQSYSLCDNLYGKNKRNFNRCYIWVLKSIITIFIANMFYFFQGNSNSLSTIDLNPGYIGLSTYNPLFAGTMITLNTYCAQINSFLYLMWHTFASRQQQILPTRQEKEQISNFQLLECTDDDLNLVISVFTATTVMPVALYWCLLLGFRNHLFIYSVFAPKAFYECFNIIVFYFNFIITNLYLSLF